MSYEETRDRLKGILTEQDIRVKRKGEDYEYLFRVRPVSTREFAGMTRGSKQGDLEEVGAGFSLIESVLTKCVINPKIVKEIPSDTPADCISIDSIPMDVCNKVFEEIFKISGLSPDEEEASKN